MSSPSPHKAPGHAIEGIIAKMESWDKWLSTPLGWDVYRRDIRHHGINAKDSNGWTIGHHAAWEGDLDVLSLYFDHGGNIHSINNGGATIGHYAARTGHINALKMYFQYGGNVNDVDNSGLTIGHRATRDGMEDALSLYFHHGGNVDVADKLGFYIGDCAVLTKNYACFAIYLDHGGDPWTSEKTQTASLKLESHPIGSIMRFHKDGGDLHDGQEIHDAWRKMLPYLIANDAKTLPFGNSFHRTTDDTKRHTHNFEILMRQAYQVDPEGFHIFLAKCSAKAVDGDDRLLQILIKAMEAP